MGSVAAVIADPEGPFTLPHFIRWAHTLVLDDGSLWEVELFEADFVQDVFDGKRECWLVVPEGNGKTTLVAGLALYYAQFQANAMIPVAASSRDQAMILYTQAEGFIDRSDWMQDAGFRARPGNRWIVFVGCPNGHNELGPKRCRLCGRNLAESTIKIFASDDATGDGVIPTLCIVDELHRHHNMRLYRTWRGKLDKRNAQMVAISTAGEPGSEFEDVRGRIRESATSMDRTETYLHATSAAIALHEFAVPADGDIDDLELVKAANPFTGVTVEQLRQKRDSPTMSDAHYRRFACNQATRPELCAIEAVEWENARSAERIPRGASIYLGLDVAWKIDCTALVPLWMKDPHFRLLGDTTIFTPPRDGTSLDPHLIERELQRIHAMTPIHTVVMDPSRAEQLASWIGETLGATVVERQQTNPLKATDYERFMEGLRNGWLKHVDDAGLTRHVLNAVTKLAPNGRTVFERPVISRRAPELQDRRVIDALTAAAMVHAYAVAELDEVEDDPEPLVALI